MRSGGVRWRFDLAECPGCLALISPGLEIRFKYVVFTFACERGFSSAADAAEPAEADILKTTALAVSLQLTSELLIYKPNFALTPSQGTAMLF
jgi:hypothetical protein